MRDALLEVLPPTAHSQLQVVAFDDRCLTLHVASAAWATRLRYMEQHLSQALAQRMRLQVDTMRIRIRPGMYTDPAPQPLRARFVSPAARRQLELAAAHIDDPALAAALRGLAAAGRRDKN